MGEARADSTCRSYNNGFKRFRVWAESHGLSACVPVTPLHCALYLLSLVQSSDSISPVINAFYSLRYVHVVVGLASPTENTLVQNVLEAGKRKLCKPVSKKKPITISQIRSLFFMSNCQSCLKDSRLMTMILVAFCGFLRSCELLNIARCDINFHDQYMSIFIEASKTDVYRDGAWVVIAATTTELCPVKHMKDYLEMANIHPESDEFVFRSLVFREGKYALREENRPLSYTRLRELFLSGIAPVVDDVSLYGLHSLRSGGATAAANNGIPDRLFKRHGRWGPHTIDRFASYYNKKINRFDSRFWNPGHIYS